MTRVISRGAKGAVASVLVLVLLAAAVVAAANLGWLSPFGISSKGSNTQVINAIKRTEEVSLLSLGIQGLDQEERSRTVFGMDVPGSGESVLMQYEFHAKLGIDGSKVEIDKTGEKAYTISIPAFMFIGYSDPTFEVADTDGGVLSWVTPDIDQVAMVNKILNGDARQTYLDSNQDMLEEQAKAFYDGIIHGVDPTITTSYSFAA